MKIKVWDNANKIMYFNAEKIIDDKWDFGRLHNNKHCTTCVSVGKLDKNGVDIYTYDAIMIGDLAFYVTDIEDGNIKIKGVNANITESLSNFDSGDISVIGSILELNKLEVE